MASSTNRLLIQLSVASASLYPMLACALGLSDLQLESRLNQPLRARIEVIDVSDEEWRLIHTRLNWQASPDIAFVQPEVLDSVTLRAIEDQSHRHYIEVRSTAVLTEPLFDLPVEVAGPSARVIRNYSVLLDPPAPGDDASQTLNASQTRGVQPALAGAQSEPTGAQSTFASAQSGLGNGQFSAARSPNAQRTEMTPLSATRGTPSTAQPSSTRRAARLHRRHRHTNVQQTKSTAADLTATAGAVPAGKAPQGDSAVADTAPDFRDTPAAGTTATSGNRRGIDDTRAATENERKNLEQQLETLQQTLAKMQDTIAAQNGRIIDLMAKVAASSQSQARQAAPTSLQTSQTRARDANAADAAEPEASPRSYFWITMGLGLTTLLALAAAIVTNWRASRSAQQLRGQPQRPIEQQTSTLKDEAARETRPNRTRAPSSFTTPSMQQKQMEADGTVEIDWHKDEGMSKTDWVRLLREGHPMPPQPIAPDPTASDAESPHETPLDSEALPAAYLDDVVKSYFADLPNITAGKQPEADTAILPATDTAPAALTMPDTAILPSADTARLQDTDTAELPEAQTTELRAADGTKFEEVDVARLLEAEVAKLTEADAAGLLNEETVKLPEPDMANVSQFPRSRRRR
jgi:hypothetical protein